MSDLSGLPPKTEWVNGVEKVTREACENRLDALLRRSDYEFARKHDRVSDADYWLAKPKGKGVDEASVAVELDAWNHINVWFADNGERELYQLYSDYQVLPMVNAFCCKIGMTPRLVIE